MLQLKAWGYTSVTVSTLADAIIQGVDLPEKPVAITFDDGDLDVYQNAFPIMQRLGMVATFYIVVERLGAPDFVSQEQLLELVNAGWEIGNHSMTHADLSNNHNWVYYEMATSKVELEQNLGIKVRSFAYPYGVMDAFVAAKVAEYGYRSAVGLGILVQHTWDTLYYLNRIEVQRSYDMSTLAGYLPWSGPTLTPSP
jgi:peptidoglycan/xylan/chitin deacetylase (PgdA/CDA1 family)